jgi:hypothetical protein
MTYSSAILATSPALFWKLEEASGTTAADASGNSRNGTATNVTWAQASLMGDGSGTSAIFDGTTADVTLAAAAWMDSTSISCVFRYTHVTSAGSRAFTGRFGTTTSTRPWMLRVNANKLGVQINNASGNTVTGATTLTNGQTYTVGLVIDSVAGTTKLYLDGVQDASATTSSPTQTGAAFRLGRSSSSLSPGQQQGVAFWTSALTATNMSDFHAAAIASGSAASGSGSVTLSGSGDTSAPGAASGALALSGSASTSSPDTGAGSLSLSGSGGATAPAVAGGALSLSGTGVADVPGTTGAGSLSLSGSGVTTAAMTAAGALSLSGLADTFAPSDGAMSLTLASSADAAAVAAGSGSLSLSGSGVAHRPAVTYPDHVLDDGAVAYWRLGEASGTTAVDATGNGHDGTYVFSPTLGVTGLLINDVDTAATFTGTPAVSVPYWSGLNLTTFTVSGMLKIGASDKGRAIIGRLGDSASPLMIGTDVFTGVITVTVNDGSGATVYSGTKDVTNFKARHIAVRRNNATGDLSIFVDGILDVTVPSTVAPSVATTYGWVLGSSTDAGVAGSGTVGTLDDWALFPTALIDADIADLATAALGTRGGGSLTLSASAGAGAQFGGAGSLSFSGLGQVPTPTGGTGYLELVGAGAAVPLFSTDTSNTFSGLQLVCLGTVTIIRAAVAPPSNLAVKQDKALPYPRPVMVGGRPT